MLKAHIENALKSKKIALMTHVLCGYPSLDANWHMLEVMDAAGVDVVELQFPFSEPIADGPVFARANQQALANGTTLADCFDLVRRASETFSFKTLMMGYYNTIHKMGEEQFCKTLHQSGAQGMIVADLPFENAKILDLACSTYPLEQVGLVAPTTSNKRLHDIAQRINRTQSILYAVARTGITGQKTDIASETFAYIKHLKSIFQVPIAVGFGIKTATDVAALIGHADVAVIGTHVLETFEKHGADGLAQLLQDISKIQ